MAASLYTALPPVAMTEGAGSFPRVRFTASSKARKPACPSSDMMRWSFLPARSWITRSESMKRYPRVLAASTPTVLFPQAGIPMRMMWRWGLSGWFMSASVGGCLSALYYIFLLLSREKMVQNLWSGEGGVLGDFPPKILQFSQKYAKMGMSHCDVPIFMYLLVPDGLQ